MWLPLDQQHRTWMQQRSDLTLTARKMTMKHKFIRKRELAMWSCSNTHTQFRKYFLNAVDSLEILGPWEMLNTQLLQQGAGL